MLVEAWLSPTVSPPAPPHPYAPLLSWGLLVFCFSPFSLQPSIVLIAPRLKSHRVPIPAVTPHGTGPQFSHLQNEENHSTTVLKLL